jgi:hypothetical protein
MHSDARRQRSVYFLAHRETSQPFVSYWLGNGKTGNITNPLALMRFWERVARRGAPALGTFRRTMA